MPVYQAYNGRIGAWVKYEFTKGGGWKAVDVKQRQPKKAFKGVKKRGKRK